jgi:hypothetical protein
MPHNTTHLIPLSHGCCCRLARFAQRLLGSLLQLLNGGLLLRQLALPGL